MPKQGQALKSLFEDTNPHPVFPNSVEASTPEQIPEGPAQQELAQSAPLKHSPPTNCAPTPFPKFAAPGGSMIGPVLGPVVSGPLPEGNPQPVLPSDVEVSTVEQIPVGLAQH